MDPAQLQDILARLTKLEEDKANDTAIIAKLKADNVALANRVEELENDQDVGAAVDIAFEEHEEINPDADTAVNCKSEEFEEVILPSVENDSEPIVPASENINLVGEPVEDFDPNNPKFVRRRIGGKICAGWIPTYITEEYTPEPEELAAYPELMPRKSARKGPMSDTRFAGKRVGGKSICVKPTGDETTGDETTGGETTGDKITVSKTIGGKTTGGETTCDKTTGDRAPVGYSKKRKSENNEDKKPMKKAKGARHDSWTDEEYELLRDSIVARRAAEEADENITPIYDMKLFEAMEVVLAGRTVHPRSALGCKNFWGRYGRAKSGLDIDRKPSQRSRSLTTSSQGQKPQKAKTAKYATNAKKAKVEEIEESEIEEEDTEMSELDEEEVFSVADDDATESSSDEYSEYSEDES